MNPEPKKHIEKMGLEELKMEYERLKGLYIFHVKVMNEPGIKEAHFRYQESKRSADECERFANEIKTKIKKLL